ncbi:MAG: helix-turn-helix domain-containing protein [Alphaproteobacteria bacterium]|nr:helix-turn-helix domain-containing protein [Alphaproteobacteria bacterium]
MSHRALEEAFKTAAPTLAAKMVMLCLAHHHNGLTGQCNPSQSLIAKETGLANVARAVKELVDAGLIEKKATKKRGIDQFKSANRYTLLFLPEVMTQRMAAGDFKAARGANSESPKPEQPPSPLRYEGGRPPAKRKRSERAKPKLRIPEDWKPKPKGVEAALELGFSDLDIEAIRFKFVNHWIGVGVARASWDATWLNWLVKEQEIRKNEQERRARLDRRADPHGERGATHDDAAVAALRFVSGEDG